MKAMVRFITTALSLRVNEAKSAVDEPKKRKFLGYTFYGRSKLRIASKSIERLKARIRELTQRSVSIRLEVRLTVLSRYLSGWMSYFRLAETSERSAGSGQVGTAPRPVGHHYAADGIDRSLPNGCVSRGCNRSRIDGCNLKV